MKHTILNLNLNQVQGDSQKAKKKSEHNCYPGNEKIVLEIYLEVPNQHCQQECHVHNDTDSTCHKHSELLEEQNIQKVLYHNGFVKPLASSRPNHTLEACPQYNCFSCTNDKHLKCHSSEENYKDTQCLCHSKDSQAQQYVCRKYKNNYQCSCGDIITININMQGN